MDVVEYSGKGCECEPSVECRGVLGFGVGRVREGVWCCGVCMVWWEGVSCGGCVGGVCVCPPGQLSSYNLISVPIIPQIISNHISGYCWS